MSEPTQPPNPTPEPGPISQSVQHSHLSARVPEKIGRGSFANGVVVLQGNQEFAIDFLQRLSKPHQVVARVILPIPVVPRLIAALNDSLKGYTNQFGPPPKLGGQPNPNQPPPPAPSVAEIYEEMKVPDEVIAGAFANGAMITHSQAEFCLDFIINMFPRSVVSSRVYLAVQQIPGMLQSLTQAFGQFQQRNNPGQQT